MTLKTWELPKCYCETDVEEYGEYSENGTNYTVYKTPDGQAVKRDVISPVGKKNAEGLFLLPLIEPVKLE